MRPIAIFQHDRTQRPGYLQRYLEGLDLPLRLFVPEDDSDVPERAHDFSGIVLLGSNRSVNDPLPWIADEMRLVRDAMALDIPVLGHCFGAQLMSKSLGGTVCKAAWPHIGWSRLRATLAGQGLLGAREVMSFNWHHETFTIPSGASRLLSSGHCLNKGFALGKHLGFQCHFEVTEEIVREWCDASGSELEQAEGPAVQSRDTILAELSRQLPAVQAVARRAYGHWVAGITRPPVMRLGAL